MKRALYFECNSGISGDMAVASLLDLGADRGVLMDALSSLHFEGFTVEIKDVVKNGIKACDFDVILEHDNHDHDMHYLHGKTACQLSHHHHHHGRNLPEILEIIDHSNMNGDAKKLASRIFTVIAEAEAEVHGKTIDTVHFHEVGAVDSIVDIVSFAVCFDNLGLNEVFIPYLCEGNGTVRCQHGMLPIPVPATAEIVRANGLNLRQIDVMGELVTPTGAGIAAVVKTKDKLPKEYSIEAIGIGAGKRQYECPGILRAMIIGYDDTSDIAVKIETNVDDCPGEILGAVMEDLFSIGVKDAFYTPVFMKKNRPAYMITVICDDSLVADVESILFRETTTIGVRKEPVERSILERRIISVDTEFGGISVKVCKSPDGIRYYPEFDSVKDRARESGRSYKEVYESAVKSATATHGKR